MMNWNCFPHNKLTYQFNVAAKLHHVSILSCRNVNAFHLKFFTRFSFVNCKILISLSFSSCLSKAWNSDYLMKQAYGHTFQKRVIVNNVIQCKYVKHCSSTGQKIWRFSAVFPYFLISYSYWLISFHFYIYC